MILHYISAFIFSLSILTVFGIGNAAKMNNINPFIIIFLQTKNHSKNLVFMRISNKFYSVNPLLVPYNYSIFYYNL